ncbi:unnamed protein product, partial [Durusdinium trenchii]
RPKQLPALVRPEVKPLSEKGLKEQLREASRKLRKRPWQPRDSRPRLEAANVKITSPREFNPVLVLNEPFPHPWDRGRVDAPRRRYPLWGLGRYAHAELQEKPPWKDPRPPQALGWPERMRRKR